MANKSSLSDKEYLTILYETRRYSGEQFDKLVVYLSSGALVLTIGFVEKIIDLSKIESLSLLYASWICFCSSLIVILISHMTSMLSIDLDIYGKEKISTGFDIVTHILNWLSLITLLFGIGSFIRFVMIAFSLKGG